jgi:GNAT superfamily N-acetyltransferase
MSAPAGWASIRPFTPDDYEAMVAVENSLYPEYGDTADEWRHRDAHREAHVLWNRYVAELDGQIVGVGGYTQSEGMYHPRKFYVYVSVRPEAQGRGIGARLDERVRGALDAHAPLVLYASAREDHAIGRAFAEKRGYVEAMREWENHLDLAAFDAHRFAGRIDQVLASGVTITTMAALADDPERDRKIFELVEAIRPDVPSPDETTPVDFDTWRSRVFDDPNLMAEGYFLALDNGQYVGLSTLWASQGVPDLYTGLTGTLRSHRRRGIALALKLSAIDYARSIGTPRIRTWNATGNEGMLAINEALGFVKQPAWIEYALELDHATAERR